MATMLRASERVGKLHAFRLSDIPEVIRMKHAMTVESRLIQSNLRTQHGVHATAEEGWATLLKSVQVIRAWVVDPSERVYRVRQSAWDAMLAEAEKMMKEAARRAVRDAHG